MTPLARTLATLAFLALMLAGLGCVVTHLAGAGGANVAAAFTGRNLLDGRFSAVLDKAVVAALPKTPALDDLASGLAYRLFGDAGAQVRAGCPGWLFLAEELVETKGGEGNLAARARLAVRIRDEMARRNIALVVLPVPDKAELAADGLCGLAVADQARGRRGAWQAASAALGLDQVEIATGWPKGAVLRTDTHWNGAGASFAARRLAEAITRRLGPGDTGVTLKESAPASRVGDLMRLAGLSRSWPWSGPAPDEVSEVRAAIARSGGLLDDVPVPSVLLAGSSYSLNSGFADRLQAASGREVAQKSREGSGFAGALLDILDATPQMLDGVRLVVWEFPMRVLTQPLTEAELRHLGDRT
ncbi:hypothetical protein K9U40_09010 [Xanthobacter autotrophicus]|uniref:alginate O-acetyltransferase AlgX-related protein n=1 Tax=Xanthobacter TaxID=279 RepID=UPI0024AC2D0E|nr:hypothetical protein [Xanthobacter autotrophicus]MDI4664461.1 hypothetical protein [Xanthobacter autotrophicus]